MNDLQFTFEEEPWEEALEALAPGENMGAAAFLTLMEGEDQEALEDAFQILSQKGILLDLSDLPRGGTGETAVRLRLEENLARQPDMTSGLEKKDPLRLYLEELAAMPTGGDPSALAREAAGGNIVAQRHLAEQSLGRVVELAREYVGWGVLMQDLIQEGSLGLWQSVLDYQQGDFSQFRDWKVRSHMVQAVVTQARARGVGQRLRQAMEDYRSVDQRLLSELGRNPTLEEMADQLHISVPETERVARMIEGASNLHRVQQQRQTPEPTPEDDQPVEHTAYFQMRQRIGELLSALSDEDAKLLTCRFGLDGGLPMSPEETGRKLGILPDQVLARETAALATLRRLEDGAE